MKLLELQISLWVLMCYTFNAHAINLQPDAGWTKMITSKNYSNTKLVLESASPFKRQYISKGYSVGTATIVCGRICANIPRCQAFNMYPTASHYICEFLHENFCFPRQRMALQAWPGGNVWDKLQPGLTRACIDQTFENQTNMTHCDIGRFGCRSVWPNCDTCVKTCSDCQGVYFKSGHYNCTLWPEDVFHPPIFVSCYDKSTYLIKREIQFNVQGGFVKQNYRISLTDMHRLWKLQVYKCVMFYFRASDDTRYNGTYQNFMIDSNGSLMNMTFKSGDDGFNVGNTPLKPTPWVKTNSDCGSFWLLNSTQRSVATMDCPGGGVNMYGKIYANNTIKVSGIRWPNATASSKTIIYTDTQMTL